MLTLVHSIHSGLNLNNLYIDESSFSLKISNIDMDVFVSNTEVGTDAGSKYLNSITSLYIDKNVPSSF